LGVTIQEAHRHAIKVLCAKRPSLARHEAHALARLLLDSTINVSHAHLQQPERELNDDELQHLQVALEEAARGRPLPYILQHREFWGLDFFVDERVLIPRPETETLVEAVLSRLENVPSPQVADLGTGSGCIAISVAHARSDARVFATDASSDALRVANLNAQKLGVSNRLTFLEGDVADWSAPLLRLSDIALDAIASNPPYIAQAEIARLQTEIVDYEPHAALDGGLDGLDCYRALATQTKVLLAPQGFLALELGAGQFMDVRAIFQAHGWHVETPIFDLPGIERVLLARPG